jgi:hypothetical protein
VHRFGTKEQMLVAVLRRPRERVFAATSDAIGERPDLATAARGLDAAETFLATLGREPSAASVAR